MWLRRLDPYSQYVIDFVEFEGKRYMLPRLPEEPKADGTRYVSRPYSGDDLQKWIARDFEKNVVCEDGTGFALGAHGDWLTRDEFETWRAHILKTGFTLRNPRKVVVSMDLEKELLALIEQGEFAAATTKLKQSTSLSLGKCKQWVLDHTPPPPKPQAPCPYCGKLLRSEKAQQCFECGMDWHDANHVVRRNSSLSCKEKLARAIAEYERGVYTRGELFPLLVCITPEEEAQELLNILPESVAPEFKEWLLANPLHGGVFVGSGEGFDVPKNVLQKLRHLIQAQPEE